MGGNFQQYLEIKKYHQNELRFVDVYSRDNLPDLESVAFFTDFHEYDDTGTNWVFIYTKSATYFDSF